LWHLDVTGTAGLTVSVQLGFVVGALVSAMLTLADLWSARRLAAAAAFLAGLTTLGVAVSSSAPVGIGFRFLTGAALAGVYPPGMKIAAGWFREARGWALGILVGALTLGSATPHLVRWAAPPDTWRSVLLVAAALAWAGAALLLTVPSDGPYAAPSPRFSWAAAPGLLRDPAVRLANLGYLGHMWELYAMWTWIAVFVAASEVVRTNGATDGRAVAALVAFGVIGIGAVGCWLGGKYGDRVGRTAVTSIAMLISGACCLVVGAFYGRSLWLLGPLLLVWGIAVVADSAQFSTAVSELSPPQYVGTALTLQTCLGFLLTTVTISLLPMLAGAIGWRWSMSMLAIGPAFGVWAMRSLRARPEALRLAGGLR
ncbi:MAG TPA: MFS transporter, partial [Gemmatimonadales bacterium]|nr:MFS transporter [Gemmatimonadales bacterium]